MLERNKRILLIIGNILSEAWKLVYGLKWLILTLTVLLPLLYLILLVVSLVIFVPHALYFSIPFYIIVISISLFVYWFALIAAYLLGIHQAHHQSLSLDTLYVKCMQRIHSLFILFMIWFVVTIIFISLNIVFASPLFSILIYLLEIYCKFPIMAFALPLIVMDHQDVYTAIHNSFIIMNSNLPIILTSQLIMAGIIFISALPFGIGLLWTMPMYYTLAGVLFQKFSSPFKLTQLP